MLFLMFLLLVFGPGALSVNEEGLYLQTLKESLSDPDGFLSWSSRDDTPCKWRGVSCNSLNSVVKLELSDANLSGPFPASSLCRLRNLAYISFSNNNLNSTLPGPELTPCSSLSHLDLSQNLLTGSIPADLSSLPELTYLDLSGNNFSGDVPTSFRKLQVISLVDNLLDGDFPNSLSNVSTLRELNLSYNPFKPTPLSDELGFSLEKIWLTNCNLVGSIPSSLGNLQNLTNLDLALNQLSGSIPTSLTDLSSIVQIELYGNNLSGELPVAGWEKLSQLRFLDASMNQLTGTIPSSLAALPLASLNLYQNHLVGKLPTSLAESPNLYELKVFGNRLTGELPVNLGLNSPLMLVDVSNNSFTGLIPSTLCSHGKLEELLMIENSFSGEIPGSLGECRSLLRVRLGNNKLSGVVPESLWGLPRVSLLELVNNDLTGGIAKTIGSASNLSVLEISKNRFSGEIPPEVGFLSELVNFVGSENEFSGSLPSTIMSGLGRLSELNLRGNKLSGKLPPPDFGMKLNELNLANNGFTGEIPAEIGSLSGLNYLDLSSNKLSGKVPDELQNLKLNVFNLSNNELVGPLPPMFAKESYRSSFLGNPGLGGGSSSSSSSSRMKGVWLVFLLAGVVLVVGVSWFYCKYRSFHKAKRSIEKSKWTLTSFHKLGFSEYEIMDCLDEDNVIGSGGSGKVYKAVLSNGEAVAVKKLWGKSSNKDLDLDLDLEKDHLEKKGHLEESTFEAEVETLGRIRHKNIVRLWCCCATRDCKLLVYEYMPNGSLGDLLHSSKAGLLLDWGTRYRIAVDAAEGLSYLHHDCVPPIVHRDVKSNNILLDAQFGARVADFGVAKVVDAMAQSMSVIAGSCGYIAPEYAYTLRVNEKSDTYSFGVVILELVTGKRPVDPEYGEKDLVKWVCTTLDQKGIDHILDPKLDSCFKDEISKVLNIGLHCTSPLPINRPSMRRVVKMLQELRDIDNDNDQNHSTSNNNSNKRDGKLSPYYYEDASDHDATSVA